MSEPHAVTQQSQPNPTLASTIYRYEKSLQPPGPREVQPKWKTGIKALDRDLPAGVFSGGTIVGFAGTDELHVHSHTLIHNLIATHLLTSHSSTTTTTTTTVFILEPATQLVSSLVSIYSILETRLQTSKAASIDIDELIDQTVLLPYLDLVGISQGLSEVSATIDAAEPSAGQRLVVVLTGLGDVVVGSTQGLALLSQVLRLVRRIVARRRSDVLVLLEVGGGEVTSAFSSVDGKGVVVGEGERKGKGGFGYGETVRLVDEVLDACVVVHDGFRMAESEKCIVEVVKAGAGGGLGSWAVWE